MNINQLVKEVHENAKAKGWWNEERSFGDIVALIHSEATNRVRIVTGESDMKWYCYRRQDGMEVRRNRWSPWLILKGYRLIAVVTLETKDVKG